MFGFLNLRKPAGPTSHDVVDQVRRFLPRREKVGHAGTLDPFAEGVLVICLGSATRLASYVQTQVKEYAAGILLGATSTTDDVEGEIAPCPVAAPPTEEAVRTALVRFVGTIQQRPPAHSAVMVAGRRAYKMARAGEAVTLAARPVTIHAITLVRYEYPELAVEVTCGSGTYIRALARDIGEALGTGGYCRSLVRTRVGVFDIADARTIETLNPHRDLIPPLAALADLPKVSLPPPAVAMIALGRAALLPPRASCGEMAILNESGELIAIGEADEAAGLLRPTKVFRTDST